MKFIIKLFTFCVCCFFYSNAFSISVSKVYRADSRPPSQIFKDGFHAWGNNINFNSHILGVSGARGTRNSAFIPTTSNSNSANRFAIDLLNVSESRVSYVYEIRPTHNFYSATDTMYHIYDAARERVPDLTRATLAREQEYSAYQNIPAQLIRSVTVYSRRADGSVISQVIRNENYVDDSTRSNEEPFTYGLPYPINVTPILVMGASLTNINNEMPDNSASLQSPSFNVLSLSSFFTHSEL